MKIQDLGSVAQTDTAEIRAVVQTDERVDALLARHHALMRSQSPAESCHVMTADELRATGAHLFAVWSGEDVLAVGAFKKLEDSAVELKSMHTLARGQGLGRQMVEHLLAQARAEGAEHVYLETGSYAVFAPARGLYASLGFVETGPFGDYVEDPYATFMYRAL